MKRNISSGKSKVLRVFLIAFLLVPIGYSCSTKERFVVGYQSDNEPLEGSYDPAKIVTITGQIFVMESPLYEEDFTIVNLNVAGTDGKNYYVQVAPSWFLDYKKISFKDGELVTVTGSLTDLTGEEEDEYEEEEEEDSIDYLIVARVVEKKGRTLTVRDRTGKPLWYRQGMLRGRQLYIKKYLKNQKNKDLGHNLGGPVSRDPRTSINPRAVPLYP